MKMSLVTVQRSPSGTGSNNSNLSDEDSESIGSEKYEKSECFFTGKGTALILALREIPHHIAERRKSLDAEKCAGNISSANLDIQQHLQSMFYLLRHEDTIKMAVKLESQRPHRTRYLAIVSRPCSKSKNNGLNISNRSTPVAIATVTKKFKKSSTAAVTYQNEEDENENYTGDNKNENLVVIGEQLLETDLGQHQDEEESIINEMKMVAASSDDFINDEKQQSQPQQQQQSRQYVEESSSSGGSILDNPSQHYHSNNLHQEQQQQHEQFFNKNYSTTKRNIYCDIPINESSSLASLSSLTSNTSSRTDNLEQLEESCLLGIDCNEKTTIGLVLRVLADTTIRLDGDGGFSISVYGKTHIFKPVSVQAMWSALQTLHKVSRKARDNNFYPGGPSHEWVSYYESRIDSDRSCLNEWNTMDSLESRRPPSPNAIESKPTKREETKQVIRMKLKEIMMSVDLDEVTSKYIRGRLEELLEMDLGEFKSFIDEEMITILGQMDAPTEIFEHVYLGSEWNASNLEELQRNGVGHILNVTREIDNFFPGMFDYFNVRVYDDEKTNLLKHWDNTYKYITRAKSEGSKVLVHCKMGVSRSASVVIAYAMKAYNWDFHSALQHVKERRNCIKPNKSFLAQLETYRGMLDAMQNKEKLQRSKSETNLKATKDARLLPGSEPTPLIQALNNSQKESGSSSSAVTTPTSPTTRIAVTTAAATTVLTETITTTTSETAQNLTGLTTSYSAAAVTSSPSSSFLSPAPFTQNQSTTSLGNFNRISTIKRSHSSVTRNFDDSRIPSSSPSSSSLISLSSNSLMPEITMLSKHQSISLENLCSNHRHLHHQQQQLQHHPYHHHEQRNVFYTAINGQNYSLTQNQIRHIQHDVDDLNMETETIENESETMSEIFQEDTFEDFSSNKKVLSSSTNIVDSCSNENPIWTSSSQLIRQSTNLELATTVEQQSKQMDIAALQKQTNYDTATSNSDKFLSHTDSMTFENDDGNSNKITTTTNITTGTTSDYSSKSNISSSHQQQMWTSTNTMMDSSLISRQSSCSSVDSAVILSGYSGEIPEGPSRQSSWGSGDNRMLPSRNSSWGSYDTSRSATLSAPIKTLRQLRKYASEQGGDPSLTSMSAQLTQSARDMKDNNHQSLGRGGSEKDEPLTQLPPLLSSSSTGTIGTVKRTKQKLEENLNTTNYQSITATATPASVTVNNSATNAFASCTASISAIANTASSSAASFTPVSQEIISNNAKRDNKRRSNNEDIITIVEIRKNRTTAAAATARQHHQQKYEPSIRNSWSSSPYYQVSENLSASAPEAFSIEKFVKAVQQQAMKQQQKQNKRATVNLGSTNSSSKDASYVQNLKKNFEAKATSFCGTNNSNNTKDGNSSKKGHSLPSSPIALHSGHKDLNVKDLVTKYQSSDTSSSQQQRHSYTSAISNRTRPRSSYESRNSQMSGDFLEKSSFKFLRNRKDTIPTTTSSNISSSVATMTTTTLSEAAAAAASTTATTTTTTTKAMTNSNNQRKSIQQNITDTARPPPVPPPVPRIPLNQNNHHHHHHHHHHQQQNHQYHHKNPTTATASITGGTANTTTISMTGSIGVGGGSIINENFHQRKVQHYGKTHPLARLSFCKNKLKLNAATYNTM